MIDYEALFKISYGLYIVCSGDKEAGNGYISNSVFQVSAKPVKFAVCCNKNNYTAEVIEKSGCFSISVLEEDTSPKLIGAFGYKSGRDTNKLKDHEVRYGKTGVPVVTDHAVAYMECKVLDKIDVGTHWMFIGQLEEAEILMNDVNPITYKYYREVKKGRAPESAPTYVDKSKLEDKKPEKGTKVYKCSVCGHIYDESKEDMPFAQLPDDWKCPVCGADKEDFMEI